MPSSEELIDAKTLGEVVVHLKYLRADEGGVSHFNYLRDNILLTWMHARLLLGFLLRLPLLIGRRLTGN